MFEFAERLYNEGKFKEALELYKKLEDEKNAEAIYSIGWYYWCGDKGVETNYKIAIEKFKKAYSLGCNKGIMKIGFCYKDGGNGLEQNFEEAIKWFKTAITEGHREGYTEIARVYIDCLHDYESAKKYLEEGSSKGEADCLGYLGQYYAICKKDYAKAITYYTRAHETGSWVGSIGLYTIYSFSGLYKDALLCAKSIIESTGKDSFFKELAAKMMQSENEPSVETAVEVAKIYFEGVNGKKYYNESATSILYAINLMRKNHCYGDDKMLFELVIMGAKIYLDKNYSDYDVETAINIIKIAVDHPKCCDEAMYLYAICLDSEGWKGYSPSKAERKMKTLAKKGYADAIVYIEKYREKDERVAREQEEKRRIEEANKLKKQRISQGVCQHCGGKFKGIFIKKCASCGNKKDY